MDEEDGRDEGEDIISCHSLCLLGCSLYIHYSWFNQVQRHLGQKGIFIFIFIFVVYVGFLWGNYLTC